MNIEISNDNILNQLKEETKGLELDKSLENMKKEAGNIIINVLDKTANYVIKSMPIPEALKDILKDVKKVIKEKDFKNIIKTLINSTIREGLEAVGISKSSITSILTMKDILQKGGLLQGLKNCVEILANKYLKSNIVGDYVYEFFKKFKDSIMSKSFKNNMTIDFNKKSIDESSFVKSCKTWYEAYEKSDFTEINQIAQELNKKVLKVKWSVPCINENKIIQNITKLVNDKKEKLSNYQLQLCKSM